MKNIIYSIIAIAACVLVGKIISYYLGGLPSSLYGLICFTLLLHMKIVSAKRVKRSIQWIIKNISVCFVPAGVGIIDHFELIQHHGLAIIFIIFISTLLLITVVGILFEMKIKKQEISQSTKHSASL